MCKYKSAKLSYISLFDIKMNGGGVIYDCNCIKKENYKITLLFFFRKEISHE